MSVPSEQGDFSSPTVPRSALFVAADEPLLLFPSVRDAEGFLEAIDVESGVYPIAYGPGGEVYSISTKGSRVLVRRDDGRDDPDALRALLVGYLEANRQTVSASIPLDELTAVVWTIERRELHGPRVSAMSFWLVLIALTCLVIAFFKLT